MSTATDRRSWGAFDLPLWQDWIFWLFLVSLVALVAPIAQEGPLVLLLGLPVQYLFFAVLPSFARTLWRRFRIWRDAP